MTQKMTYKVCVDSAQSHVIYVVVQPYCFFFEDVSDYGCPLAIRKLLPSKIPLTHNLFEISSDGDIVSSHRKFKSIETIWHPNSIDVTTLSVLRELITGVFKVKCGEGFLH